VSRLHSNTMRIGKAILAQRMSIQSGPAAAATIRQDRF